MRETKDSMTSYELVAAHMRIIDEVLARQHSLMRLSRYMDTEQAKRNQEIYLEGINIIHTSLWACRDLMQHEQVLGKEYPPLPGEEEEEKEQQ
jgi:hypothetical protein